MQFLIKVLVTSIIVAGVSELAKRYSFAAAILASLPLTSILALSWLHVETGDDKAVAVLSSGIFWMVIPSLLFFLSLPFALKRGLGYWPSLLLSSLLTFVAYTVYSWVLRKTGVQI